MRIPRIRVARLEHPLRPPFNAAWDPVPRTSFAATLVRVETDEGVTGIGSGDTGVRNDMRVARELAHRLSRRTRTIPARLHALEGYAQLKTTWLDRS